MRALRLTQDDISGEVAIVTGASRGLGLELARELGRHSVRLVICARGAATLREAADDLRASGAEVTAISVDLGDDSAAQMLIETALATYGRLDIIVNSAGIIQVGPVANSQASDYESAIRTMALAPARLTLAALPMMRERGHGRIVNVTSIGGKISVPHLLPYCMAKFAEVAFSEGLRAELGSGPVTVTTAVPGLMRTGSHLQAMFRGQQEKEFTWFSLSASLPVISIDATRAARKIVSAMRSRRAEVFLTPVAQIAARGAAISPGLTTMLLHAFSVTLPDAADGPGKLTPGKDLSPALPEKLFGKLTAMGRSAARRLNQVPGS
jgi:short-subunit dehydrogenase